MNLVAVFAANHLASQQSAVPTVDLITKRRGMGELGHKKLLGCLARSTPNSRVHVFIGCLTRVIDDKEHVTIAPSRDATLVL